VAGGHVERGVPHSRLAGGHAGTHLRLSLRA
jgi:hypothetical protein